MQNFYSSTAMTPMDSQEDPAIEKQDLTSDMRLMDDEDDLIIKKSELTRRKTTLNLICLTLGLGGLQGVFAVQFGNGSEYLTSLGLSKPLMSLVWLAGPISGAVLQPYFCLCSDESQSRWGRRRPFIVGGSAAIIVSLLGQAWAPSFISGVFAILGIEQYAKLFANTVATTVVLLVITLNIAVQPVQGCLRALIVDSCPKNQQDAANAWAGRIISIANVLSYFCGYMDLPSWFPFLGRTQFSVLCTITSILLGISVAITCWTVRESPVSQTQENSEKKRAFFRKLGRLVMSFRQMPLEVQRVCMVQFFAWMGWFPFLFYIEIYIHGKYLANFRAHAAQPASVSAQAAARTGSLGMLTFALLSLVSSIIIPTFVQPKNHFERSHLQPSIISRCMNIVAKWTSSIRRLWMLSHILYATCIMATIFVSSVSGSIILVGMAGISWAVTIWAPYAIISTAISVDDDTQQADQELECPLVSGDEPGQRLGTVIGLHNVAIAVPQIVAALLCGFVFWLFDGSGLGAPEESVGWVLRIGGLSAVAAAFLTTRLDDGTIVEYCKIDQC